MMMAFQFNLAMITVFNTFYLSIVIGKLVMVTLNKNEIEEEFSNDSDMKSDAMINKAQ